MIRIFDGFADSWYFLVGLLVLLGLFTRAIIRRNREWKCPACGGTKQSWEGSGTREGVEYRRYDCACGAKLVKEAWGPLQHADTWVPGKRPEPPPRAKAR